MNQASESRSGWIARAIGFVIGLGFVTTILSSMELSNTIDENIYVKAGLDYLNTLSFEFNNEHPPFSKWFGALIAWLFSLKDLFWFRLPHVILFFYGGLVFTGHFRRVFGVVSALLFALLYFCDPNIKAMASLHINDFDVALFVLLSAFYAYRLCEENVFRPANLFFAFFFFALAILSKFTGLFYLPFLLMALYLHLNSTHREQGSWPSRRYFLLPLAGVAAAFLISYLFQVDQVHWFGKGIDAQRLHNRAETHPAFLWGQISNSGFKTFYLVSLWAKMPPGHLLLWLASLIYFFFKGPKNFKALFVLTLLPAIALLVHLSLLNVQTGLRYYLPGIVLMHLFSAFVLSDFIKSYKAPSLKALILIYFLFVIPDTLTFYRHSFLSYFNFWVSSPTRDFSDSNIEWKQGLPERVEKKLPSHLKWRELRPSIFEENQEQLVLVGARDLSGLAGLRGALMRAFTPVEVIGGYELHRLDRRDALRLFNFPVTSSYDALAKVDLFSRYLAQCRDYEIKSQEGRFVDECPQILEFMSSQ
ncbi:hypothetical protein GW915_02610 [bacterium]|nr:hypothetical protein [bacterium]